MHDDALRSAGDRGRDAVALQLQVADLVLELRLELVAGALEFAQRLPYLPADFGQLLGPEDQQGEQENEDHLWKAELHGSMIIPFFNPSNGASRNSGSFAAKWVEQNRNWVAPGLDVRLWTSGEFSVNPWSRVGPNLSPA